MGKKSRNRSAKNIKGDGFCSHAGSAIPAMKKSLGKAPDLTTCRTCKPNMTENDGVDEKELFVCLRCCHVACRQHISDHYRSPRSDIHSHFLSTKSGIAHCIACDFRTLDEDENHIIRSAVSFLLQQLKKTSGNFGCVNQEQTEDWRAKAIRNVQSDIKNQVLSNGDEEKNIVKETSRLNGRSSDSPNGLLNLGSTCYMNSSLQSLAACKNVRSCFDNFFLQAIPVHLTTNSGEVEKLNVTFQYQDGALPERLAEVLRRVRPFEPEWKNAPPETSKLVKSKLIGLKDEFTQRHPQFSNNWAEQDAHEFLRHFVDMVSENMKKRVIEVCKEEESEIFKKISSVVESIFRSTLLYVKHCDKCDHYSTNLEHVLDLCVALDKDVPSSNIVRVTGAGVDLKRTNVPLSKHKLKKLRKEQKKKNRKHRNTNDRHVTEPQTTQGIKEDDHSDNESESESDSYDKKDDLGEDGSCVNGIHKKEDNDQGFPVFGQWDPSKDLSSSEDETNYDIFSLDVSNYSSIVREAGDEEAEEDNRNTLNDMESEHCNKMKDLEADDWRIGSKFTSLSSGYLTGMQPVYASSAKNENYLNDVLVNRLLMEDLANLESNEDDLVPLFNDFSTDVSVQPSGLDIHSNLEGEPDCLRSVSRCSMECELSSTRAEIDISPTDLSSGEDLSDDFPGSGELGVNKENIPFPGTNNAAAISTSDKEGSSSDDTIEQEKDLDPETAKMAAQTLRTSSVSSGLEQLLEKYFEETSLDDFKCPTCKNVGTTTSQQVVIELPPVLMITVKRFRSGLGQTQKIAASVDFPATLDLSTFTSRVALGLRCNSSRKYRLRAVIQHHGSARSGHYVAYVSVSRTPSDISSPSTMTVRRGITVEELTSLCNSAMVTDDTEDAFEGQPSDEREDENWFLVSDMTVDSASLSEVLRAQAYILFYERC